jgi:hypothetical protein
MGYHQLANPPLGTTAPPILTKRGLPASQRDKIQRKTHPENFIPTLHGGRQVPTAQDDWLIGRDRGTEATLRIYTAAAEMISSART